MPRLDSRLVMALMTSTALAGPPLAVAGELPAGASVVSGRIGISNPNSDTLRIRQSSQAGIVNWGSFSIGAGNRVSIHQPGRDATLLNRVTGSTPSTIAGRLDANGQVYLINPNGIAITKSGVVNTGAFVASTLDIGNDDFLAGKRGFAGGGHSAAVSNRGSIEVGRGGYAALLGGHVANAGTISVPLGKIGLGAGEAATLDLSGDGFLEVAIPSDGPGRGALIRQSGHLKADGGRIEISAATARAAARDAVNLSGLVEARTVSGHSGAIVLGGGEGGTVRVSGRLDASGHGRRAHGGSITVTGRHIALRHARLDASGQRGGGEIRIGGDAHGGGTLPRAATTVVDKATTIRANALDMGGGGSVVLWSDDATRFTGRISARGGALGGDGGFAEVSGHVLAYHGMADLRAPAGEVGTLLLDPYDVTISNAPTSNIALVGGTYTPGNTSVLNAGELTTQLGSASVTVTTTGSGSDPGNITLQAALSWAAGTTLTLSANSNVTINAPIAAAAGGLAFSAGSSVAINSPITVGGGLAFSAAGAGIAINAPVTTTAGNLTLVANGTISASAAVQIGGTFLLQQGDWLQNAAGGTLPAFSARDFRVESGSFRRVLGGDGTTANPFQIADVYGLQGIGTSFAFLSGSYVLANNIDASGTVNWNGGAGFAPIGGIEVRFIGTFEGAGHTIDRLTINQPGNDFIGLFGMAEGATISDVGLTNVSIIGEDNVGGLIGLNAGTVPDPAITHAFTTGSVSGVNQVGGLIGLNQGSDGQGVSVVQSFSTASVNATGVGAGGLVGENQALNFGTATILQSYATGSVTSTGTGVGGLVGVQTTDGSLGSAASITESYATGQVTGTAGVGGLVGTNTNGSVTTSFWDSDTTGLSTSAGGGTPLTTAQFQNPVTFVPQAASWNFATTWSPPTTFGGGFYPELYTMSPVIRVITNNTSRLYGANSTFTVVGTDGGPGTYIFGPSVDPVDLSAVLTSTATLASPIGTYPVFGIPAPATSGGVTYRTVATLADAAVVPSLAVNPAPLTITADALTKIYGGTFTFAGTEFSTAGLRNSDTVTAATLSSLGAAAIATVAGSPYAVAISNAAGTGLANYAITYKPGTLAVAPAPLTVTADDLSKTYGDTITFAGTEFTVAGLKNGDTVTTAKLASLGARATATVAGSPYAIAASHAAGTGLANYAITYKPGALAVRRAPLTVTADDQTKTADDAFTFAGTEFTVTGLKNADAVTSATMASPGAAKNATVAGSPYPITISNAAGTGLANYDIAYAAGSFTVEPSAARTTATMLPMMPSSNPIFDPPDIIDVNLGGGGPIITLPETNAPPTTSTTLTYLQQNSQQLEQQLAACERRQIRDHTRAYIDCVATALDGFGRSLERRVVDLPPPLRAVTAIIRTAVAQVRAARTVGEARAAVQTAITAVRKVITLLKADDPAVARLQRQEGTTIATALQSVDTHLARAVGL
jgi:filamentous hemagglutinin family protein